MADLAPPPGAEPIQPVALAPPPGAEALAPPPGAIPIASDQNTSWLQRKWEHLMAPDPATQEMLRAEYELDTAGYRALGDVARGAAQNVTGLAEMLPGAPGRWAAQATRYLNDNTESKVLGDVGYAAPWLYGMGEANALVPAAKTVLGSVARGAGLGGATGLVQGAATPTGEEDTTKRYAEKGESSAVNGVLGAGVGAVLEPAVQAGGYLKTAFGKAASEAESKFASSIRAEAAKAAEDATRAQTDLQKAVAAKSPDLAKYQAEAARTQKALEQINGRVKTLDQEALPSREEKRAAAGRDDRAPAGTNVDLKQGAVERAAEKQRLAEARRKEWEQFATERGDKAHEARAFADEQAERVTRAEQAGDQIAEELRANPRMTKVELGGKVQKQVDDLVERLTKEREKEAGFAQAVASDGGKLSVDTSKIRGFVRQSLPNIRNAQTRAAIDAIHREISNELKLPNGQIAEVRALNLRQADSLRKNINHILNTKTIAAENGTAVAVNSEAATYLRTMKSLLEEAAAPPGSAYRAALDKFEKFSRPLDAFNGKGALAGVTRNAEYTDDFLMEKGAVAARLLGKTEQGSEAVQQLLKDDPSLKDSIRQFFNRELFGPQTAPKEVSAATLRAFLDENEQVLKTTGLGEEFGNLYQRLTGSEKEIAAAREALERTKTNIVQRAEEEAKAASAASKDAAREAEQAQKLKGRAVQRLQEAQNPKAAPGEKTPDQIAADRAKDAAERLKEQNTAATKAAKDVQSDIDKAAKEADKLAESSQKYRDFVSNVDSRPIKTSKEVITKGLKYLRKDERLSDEQYQAYVQELGKVEELQVNQAEARTRLKHLALAAATAAGVGGGFELYHFGYGIFGGRH